MHDLDTTNTDQSPDPTLFEINDWTIDQAREAFPDLVARIEASVRVAPVAGAGHGFQLAIGDPFAEGVLRTYERSGGYSGLQLPFVLPFKDPATRPALAGYLIRARSSGRKDLIDAAEKAMAKLPKQK